MVLTNTKYLRNKNTDWLSQKWN